ncbi:MAG TPA: hypothetical protein VHL98_11315 [Microvirga sp.]|jgi:hypothetical protein|nr:hypothetical protein [Microvirga sp.]
MSGRLLACPAPLWCPALPAAGANPTVRASRPTFGTAGDRGIAWAKAAE